MDYLCTGTLHPHLIICKGSYLQGHVEIREEHMRIASSGILLL